MKAKTYFLTIRKDGSGYAYDYPQNVPLPHKGEHVIFDCKSGRIAGYVDYVSHTVTEGLVEIKIVIKN